jgi:uncharacterized protein (DUF305 family)
VRRTASALLLLVLLIAGCGGDGGGLFTASGGPGSDPNPTDAEFARTMVENDASVGALAALARELGLRKELRKLARATLERQSIQRPRLRDAAAGLASRGIRPAGRNPVPPAVDPRKLRRAVSFDHEFMVMMIRAHEHAVAAAEVERDRGGDPKLKRLAAEIHESRSRDLEQLRRWLHTWYGEGTLPGEGGGGGGGGEPTEPAPGDGGGGEPRV